MDTPRKIWHEFLVSAQELFHGNLVDTTRRLGDTVPCVHKKMPKKSAHTANGQA